MTNWTSRSICPENFTGEKGQAAAATEGEGAACARDLGIGWKISPCVSIRAGETFELAKVDGSGVVTHIWCTDNADMNRQLILRIYWDGNDFPSVEVPACDFFACADYQEPSIPTRASTATGRCPSGGGSASPWRISTQRT